MTSWWDALVLIAVLCHFSGLTTALAVLIIALARRIAGRKPE